MKSGNIANWELFSFQKMESRTSLYGPGIWRTSLYPGWSWKRAQNARGVTSHLSTQVPLWEARTFFLLLRLFVSCLWDYPYAHIQQLEHCTDWQISLQTLPAAAKIPSQRHSDHTHHRLITNWLWTEVWLLTFWKNTYLKSIMEKNNKNNTFLPIIKDKKENQIFF